MVAVENPTKAALSALPRRCRMGLPALTCSKVFQNAHLVPSLFREGDHRVSYREEVNTVAIIQSLVSLLLRLTVQDRDRIAVKLLGARATIPDTHRAELTKLGERPDQVEH